MNKLLLILPLLITMSGCVSKPPTPYQPPPPGIKTAKLRIITNSGVQGSPYKNCTGDTMQMASAGRFKNGKAAINYPQYPVTPSKLGMPKRLSPQLSEYLGATRMAEGNYAEVETEYLVPADIPFLIQASALTAGSYGSTWRTCPEYKNVYTFESDKNYELYTGLRYMKSNDGTFQPMCIFVMQELVPLGISDLAIPKAIASSSPIEKSCPTPTQANK